VHLARVHRQVEAFQDVFVFDTNAEILDAKKHDVLTGLKARRLEGLKAWS
jgi:hypothetical protein